MTPNETTSLRRHYAGLAMQSILNLSDGRGEVLDNLSKENKHEPHDQVAKMAFEMADAMLKWEQKHYIAETEAAAVDPKDVMKMFREMHKGTT